MAKKSYIRVASSCVTAMTISPLLADFRNDTKLALSATVTSNYNNYNHQTSYQLLLTNFNQQ